MTVAVPRLTREDLISPAYLRDQVWLHRQPRGYGGRGRKWADVVVQLAQQYGCQTALDYGCGQGSLKVAVGAHLKMREYDPAIPGKDALPKGADLVVCTDVLEHIEPDKVWNVVRHLAELTGKVLLAVISTVPSEKRLPDGRGAHILLRNPEWWKCLLDEHDFVVADELPIRAHKQWVGVLTRRPRC